MSFDYYLDKLLSLREHLVNIYGLHLTGHQVFTNLALKGFKQKSIAHYDFSNVITYEKDDFTFAIVHTFDLYYGESTLSLHPKG